jgi:hypothetical protein
MAPVQGGNLMARWQSTKTWSSSLVGMMLPPGGATRSGTRTMPIMTTMIWPRIRARCTHVSTRHLVVTAPTCDVCRVVRNTQHASNLASVWIGQSQPCLLYAPPPSHHARGPQRMGATSPPTGTCIPAPLSTGPACSTTAVSPPDSSSPSHSLHTHMFAGLHAR